MDSRLERFTQEASEGCTRYYECRMLYVFRDDEKKRIRQHTWFDSELEWIIDGIKDWMKENKERIVFYNDWAYLKNVPAVTELVYWDAPEEDIQGDIVYTYGDGTDVTDDVFEAFIKETHLDEVSFE